MTASILITGAGGQVGHELAIADSRHRLIALTRAELDITDPARVGFVFEEYRPDLVINAAAYTQVDRAESEREQAFAINCDGVRNLADACALRELPLLHVSTDYVFSGDGDGNYLEQDVIAPRSVYGESKAAGEVALRTVLAEHVILRTSWVYSATGNNFVKTMLRLGRERSELGIVGDQHGCPTAAHSIAAALLQLADLFLQGAPVKWGSYHYCSEPATTWFDFAEAIFARAGGFSHLKLKRIKTSDYPTAAVRPANSTLNCDKFSAAFGLRQSNWIEDLDRVLRQLTG